MDQNIVVIIGKVIWLLFVISVIYGGYRWVKRKRKYLYEKCDGIKRNAILVGIWILGIFLLGVTLYVESGMIKAESIAHVDGIIGTATIIGIIGAVWAVFARIDAEQAFIQSKKTYDAIGATFDFITILDDEKYPSVITKIGTNGSRVCMYLGFPCVAFLFIGKDKLRTKPIDQLKKLVRKLEDISYEIAGDMDISYSFKIGYFKKELANEIVFGLENVDANNKKILADQLENFYRAINDLKEKNHPNIQLDEISADERFRYVTIDCPPLENEKKDRRAYNWVVSKLYDKEKKITKPFDSMVFQTSEEKFVRLLEEAF